MRQELPTKQSRGQRGVVEEVLPNQMYRVRLEDGRTVRAGLSTTIRHQVVRIISGSAVIVMVSTHDPNRGQIVSKAQRSRT